MKTNSFKDIMLQSNIEAAKILSHKSTCLRRQYGAVILSNKTNKFIGKGYNHNVSCKGCVSENKCLRNELNIPSGERYELCKSIHAEMSAILNTSDKKDLKGSSIFIYGYDLEKQEEIIGYPCLLCSRMILESSIRYVYVRDPKTLDLIRITRNELIIMISDKEKYMEAKVV